MANVERSVIEGMVTVLELNVPGPQGPPGIGSEWVQGAGVPGAGLGGDGDFYLDTATGDIYGPKAEGAWGAIIFNIAEGQQGPAGAAGVNGADGADGADGTDGADGLSVLNGAGAPDAGLGVDGEFYIDTVATAIYGPKTAGAWGSPTSLIGADGAPGINGTDGAPGTNGADGAPGADGADGADGLSVLSGTGAPSSGLGRDGEFYIDTTADAIYGPKTDGNWGSPTSLIGPAGADGADGATGPSGGSTNWRGTWDPATAYVASTFDAVTYEGSSYVAIADSTNQAPPNVTFWQLLAAKGDTGATGPAGANGADGAPGADGADGTDGIDGRTILSGTVDPTTEGENGDFYINTSSSTLFGPKATGTWPSGVLLIGADGADGADGVDGAPGAAGANGIDGRTILNGSGAPDSGLGVDGDFYIDTTADAIYGPKTAGAWGSPTSLIGPAGADGTGITDGDKGDITVSASGATWTVDNGAITLAKQADVATATVFYRKTAGTGAPEVQSLATLKTDLDLSGTNTGDQDLSGLASTGAIGSTGITMSTARLLGRSTASTGAVEEITLGTNLSFSGTTLNAEGGGGGATPAGSAGQIQVHDGQDPAGLGAVTGFKWDSVGAKLDVPGDINLDDGGSFQTTLQLVTPTAARTITFPDATGTVGLVAGSTGQLVFNLDGAYSGGPLYDNTKGTLGYTAGGTFTQASNKSTGVTLEGASGRITLNAAALAANTTVSFTLTNTSITANDLLLLNHVSGGTAGAYTLNGQAGAGTASINVRNVTGGSLSEAIVIGFAVLKA
jgi:hypothetical protein